MQSIQLATLNVDELRTRLRKLYNVRALAYLEAGECKLVSRNLKHFKSFDHLKKSLDKLPVKNAILDGEVVRLDAQGVSRFNALMSRKGKLVFYAFDLLWLNGARLAQLASDRTETSLA
jgi:bifunctional non-homologous end joining protein LigD